MKEMFSVMSTRLLSVLLIQFVPTKDKYTNLLSLQFGTNQIHLSKTLKFTRNKLFSGGIRISQRRGRQTPRWVRQPIIWSKFSQERMKMKEFVPRGGGTQPWRPP